MLRVRYNRDTFSLDRMAKLAKKLGNPHEKFRSVHIAGTKGKGSTATMLARMLQACGLKVGLYTSPHLCDIRERIRVNGDQITQAALARLIGTAEPHLDAMAEEKPTFFEIFTALAFRHFADEKVDIAVIETGLGGRLDSTNIVLPEVVGLTSISMDHTQQLGNTLTKIATEKAGIFKPDVAAVSVAQEPEVRRALRKVAKEKGIDLAFAGDDIEFSYRVESSREQGCHARICLTTPRSRFEHLPVPLWGEHQAVNCGLALAMLDQLKLRGFDLDDHKAVAGLKDLALPGRMEMVSPDPRMLLDGAHNAASMAALMRAIAQHIPYDSMVMIFGCGGDKDITGMMEQMATGADKVIFTRATNNPRAACPRELAEAYEEHTGRVAQVADSVCEAVRVAFNAVSREDIICACGSFHLIGEIKQTVQA